MHMIYEEIESIGLDINSKDIQVLVTETPTPVEGGDFVNPNGYMSYVLSKSIKRNSETYCFVMQEKETSFIIGYLIAVRTKYGFFETHSKVNYPYMGRGYGAAMYKEAIKWLMKKGEKVQSSAIRTQDGEGLWNSKELRKHFRIKKTKTRYCVVGGIQ